jgi:hypothetical protein
MSSQVSFIGDKFYPNLKYCLIKNLPAEDFTPLKLVPCERNQKGNTKKVKNLFSLVA